MSMPLLKKLGKQPEKQIQDAVALWGSTPARFDGKLFDDLVPSLGAASLASLDILHMPEVAATTLQLPPCCFPHASPVFCNEAGKRKTALEGRSKQFISLRKSGAGEGIRTLDPNLGKVVLYP